MVIGIFDYPNSSSMIVISASVSPRLNRGATPHQCIERFVFIKQHAVSQHPRVIVGKYRIRYAGRYKLQTAGDRCLIVNPFGMGIILHEEYCLVTGNRKSEFTVSERALRNAGFIEARKIMPVS